MEPPTDTFFRLRNPLSIQKTTKFDIFSMVGKTSRGPFSVGPMMTREAKIHGDPARHVFHSWKLRSCIKS